jgi:hypothetical protein
VFGYGTIPGRLLMPDLTAARMVINYDILPEHIRGGFQRYIENHVKPGSFVTLCLENDLVHSFGAADPVNIERMFDIAKFLYNDTPGNC